MFLEGQFGAHHGFVWNWAPFNLDESQRYNLQFTTTGRRPQQVFYSEGQKVADAHVLISNGANVCSRLQACLLCQSHPSDSLSAAGRRGQASEKVLAVRQNKQIGPFRQCELEKMWTTNRTLRRMTA
mmetsp:Transcript_52043/g.106092  ORF Transcript_52043/g.106092 Transcript_52043/m.106092 type:complete len:127 (+) Transcript_52043:352-732(+)